MSQVYSLLIFAVGITSVVISILLGNEFTVNIKPIFHLLLLAYYIVSVKQIKIPVLVFFVCAMVGETLVAKGFEENYQFIVFLFTACFASGIVVVYPFLGKTVLKFKLPEIITTCIVIFGVGYIMVLMFNIFTNRLQEYVQFGLVSATFIVYIASCFYIAAFNTHPKRLSLFLVGCCYIITVVGTLIHELFFQHPLLMGLVNLSEIIAQFSFAYFAVHYYKKRTVTSELI